MFSSKIKDGQPASFAPTASKKPSSAPSIVSADMAIQGAVNSAGDVHVDGRVDGDVRSVGLVIGEHAEIRGEIFAEDLTVRGTVIGRIHARKVLLAATSHVEGDILHEALTVEAGAFFEGNCRHSDNPLGSGTQAEDRQPQESAHAVGLFAPLTPVAT
jgi:cytoskeletal protein CcmA (bactofilin family)